MNKNTIIVILIVAVIAYFLVRKNKSAEKSSSQVTDGGLNDYSETPRKTAAEKREMSPEEIAEQEDLEKRITLAKKIQVTYGLEVSPYSNTLEELRTIEKDYQAKTEINRQIAELGGETVNLIDDNHETLEDMTTVLVSIQKEKDAQARQALIEQWNSRKTQIESITKAFRDTIDNRGNSFNHLAWNTGALTAMTQLADNELVYANQYFAQTLGGVNCPNSYGGTKIHRTTLSDAIPSGDILDERRGASVAIPVREYLISKSNLWGKTVNEIGQING